MRDVATRAGVSFKTVSRVVNDEPGVSAQLAERVREAIAELGYRPDPGARTLRRADRRSGAIALLLENVANPFSAALHRAVEDVAHDAGLVLFSASLDENPARERALVTEFVTRHIDGLILASASSDLGYLADVLSEGIAIVSVDREAVGLPVDSVLTTNALGAAHAVRHLSAAGHRRIAYLGDRHTIPTARQRYSGYLEGLDDAGLPADPSLVVHDLRDEALAAAAVSDLLTRPDPPTALFTAQNLVTIGAVRAIRRHRLQYRVALVGFDDFPLADLLEPGITVVAQDPVEIGRRAAEQLLTRIGGDHEPPSTRLVRTELIKRGSGEIPARGDG